MLPSIKRDFQVRFEYQTSFTRNLFDPQNNTLVETIEGEGKKVLVVVDAGVADTHPDLSLKIQTYCDVHASKMSLVCEPIVVCGGETIKNSRKFVERIHDAVDIYGVDRHSYIIAIGGGAVLDAVGYAAATAHRGIRIIRVPTTVLSQNDAGVGVKNSVNAYGKKNFIGTFAPPVAVLNDFEFLTTLDYRDWVGGVPEAIKVALLKDPGFFEYIESNATAIRARDMKPMEWVIYRCAELHMAHIATNGDPFEMGSSRPLDFGHWAAHKLEQLSDYSIRHGEAVAIGIALDVTYSYHMGMIGEEEWCRVLHTFSKLGMQLYAPELETLDETGQHIVFSGLTEFREHLGGQLTVMLLEGIGKGVEVHEVDTKFMARSIDTLREYEAQAAQQLA